MNINLDNIKDWCQILQIYPYVFTSIWVTVFADNQQHENIYIGRTLSFEKEFFPTGRVPHIAITVWFISEIYKRNVGK